MAVSDALGWTAQGVTVVHRKSLADDLQSICGLITKYQATQVVIGLPLNMNGSSGPQALATHEFASSLQAACPVEIVFQDERLTTAAARRTLLSGDASRQKRKQVVDMLAAQMILDTFMARRKT